jgi:two-component system, chemotaxis family, sensor kinase CheA
MSAEGLPEEILLRFRQLVAERLLRAESIWFTLRQGTGTEADAAELLRLVHTLKGDARVVGFADVDLVCHKLEDLLAVAHDVAYAVPEDLDLVVTMSFHFIGLLTRKRGSTPVAGIDLDGFVQEVDQAVLAARTLERFGGTSLAGSTSRPTDPVLDSSLDQESRLARAATLAFVEQLVASGASRLRLHQLWSLLRQEVAQSSSMALDHILPRHLVAAHELGAQLGKLVDVHVDTDTRGLCLPRRVTDALDVGLLHCIRNAVDHGLERPDERTAVGKPPRGSIRITVHTEDGMVAVAVADDGRGLDHHAIVQRAQETGLLDASARASASTFDPEELVFRPGFSTAQAGSRVSGRGVGLDAVRSALRAVGGEVSARPGPDGGAIFVLRVPARTHHMEVHVFQARAGALLAVPATWEITLLAPLMGSGPACLVVDPLEALGIVERAAGPAPHVLQLRRGGAQVCYAAASLPILATAERICPTTSSDPMEVVLVQGREQLMLRPDQLAGAVGASAPSTGERAT